MNTASPSLSEHLDTPRRPRRKKTVSSLSGMFEEKPEDLKSVNSYDSIDRIKGYPSAERDSLRLVSRRLHQTKRKLFLKCVETPEDPVDKLRDILLKISLEATSDEFSKEFAQETE